MFKNKYITFLLSKNKGFYGRENFRFLSISRVNRIYISMRFLIYSFTSSRDCKTRIDQKGKRSRRVETTANDRSTKSSVSCNIRPKKVIIHLHYKSPEFRGIYSNYFTMSFHFNALTVTVASFFP